MAHSVVHRAGFASGIAPCIWHKPSGINLIDRPWQLIAVLSYDGAMSIHRFKGTCNARFRTKFLVPGRWLRRLLTPPREITRERLLVSACLARCIGHNGVSPQPFELITDYNKVWARVRANTPKKPAAALWPREVTIESPSSTTNLDTNILG